jgi:hypothetical protein
MERNLYKLTFGAYQVEIISNDFWLQVFITFLGSLLAIIGAILIFKLQNSSRVKEISKNEILNVLILIRQECTFGIQPDIKNYNQIKPYIDEELLNVKKAQNYLEKIRILYPHKFLIFNKIIDDHYGEVDEIKKIALKDVENDTFQKKNYYDFLLKGASFFNDILKELESLYDSL